MECQYINIPALSVAAIGKSATGYAAPCTFSSERELGLLRTPAYRGGVVSHEQYKRLLYDTPHLAHVLVEVNQCFGALCKKTATKLWDLIEVDSPRTRSCEICWVDKLYLRHLMP